ncbi:MAG: response regulator [Candidatus Hydrogenedentes bacterium]|nr:response regulator [Candidatus Hydrogenedentota bacterium]
MALVLIADDDASTVELLTAALAVDGHEVLWAINGQEAIELTLVRGPDLVFLSPTLPVFNGYETCATLRGDPEVPPGLPIVFLVAHDLDPVKMEQVGVTADFPKRHTHAELRELLLKHLGEKAVA